MSKQSNFWEKHDIGLQVTETRNCPISVEVTWIFCPRESHAISTCGETVQTGEI
jgi:hypothetical protein